MVAVRNEETLQSLIERLEVNCGDIADACQGLCSTGWLRKWMRDDPKVDAAIQDAMETGALGLESAMIKRATVGWEEPVFYKEEQVGTKRKFSDTLLIKALEGRKRDVYGKSVEINQNVNIRNMTDQELDRKIDALMSRMGLKQLPAPEEGEYADFEPVTELSLEDLL